MKTLIISILLSLPGMAFAQSTGPLDFLVYQPAPGVLSFTDFYATDGSFPYYGDHEIKTVRVYYSKFGFQHITPDSRYVEFPVKKEFGEDGFTVIAPSVGNAGRPGDKLFFQVNIVDETGHILFIPGDVGPNLERHSLVYR